MTTAAKILFVFCVLLVFFYSLVWIGSAPSPDKLASWLHANRSTLDAVIKTNICKNDESGIYMVSPEMTNSDSLPVKSAIAVKLNEMGLSSGMFVCANATSAFYMAYPGRYAGVHLVYDQNFPSMSRWATQLRVNFRSNHENWYALYPDTNFFRFRLRVQKYVCEMSENWCMEFEIVEPDSL